MNSFNEFGFRITDLRTESSVGNAAAQFMYMGMEVSMSTWKYAHDMSVAVYDGDKFHGNFGTVEQAIQWIQSHKGEQA